jgi:hydroxylamine reductase
LADTVVSAVKSGAIKRFVVMGGCDGRQSGRSYYTDVAEALPEGAVILTAGCAKYRYNKLDLGDIGGIPGCWTQASATTPIPSPGGPQAEGNLRPGRREQASLSFDIAWYEQKAVLVLLALLYLGFKNISSGPPSPDSFPRRWLPSWWKNSASRASAPQRPTLPQ